MNLQSIFNHLVDLTEPICQRIDAHKAAMVLFDTSGIKARVTENNPKYANRIIRQLKSIDCIISCDAYGFIGRYRYLLYFHTIKSRYLPPPSENPAMSDFFFDGIIIANLFRNYL